MKLLLFCLCLPLAAQVTETPVKYQGRDYIVTRFQPRPVTCPPPEDQVRELHNCVPLEKNPQVRYQVVGIDKVRPHIWGPDENNWLVGYDFYADRNLPPDIAAGIALYEHNRRQEAVDSPQPVTEASLQKLLTGE